MCSIPTSIPTVTPTSTPTVTPTSTPTVTPTSTPIVYVLPAQCPPILHLVRFFHLSLFLYLQILVARYLLKRNLFPSLRACFRYVTLTCFKYLHLEDHLWYIISVKILLNISNITINRCFSTDFLNRM